MHIHAVIDGLQPLSSFFSAIGGLQFVDSNVHGISGTVTLPDSRTIVINDFNYDGLGVGKRECYIYLYAKLM